MFDSLIVLKKLILKSQQQQQKPEQLPSMQRVYNSIDTITVYVFIVLLILKARAKIKALRVLIRTSRMSVDNLCNSLNRQLPSMQRVHNSIDTIMVYVFIICLTNP